MAAKTIHGISRHQLNKKIPKWHRLASPKTSEVRPVGIWVEPASIIESNENPAEVAAQVEEVVMHKKFLTKANQLSRFQKDIKLRVKLLEKFKDEQRRQEYEKAMQLEIQTFDKGSILEIFLPTNMKTVGSSISQPLASVASDGRPLNDEALSQIQTDVNKTTIVPSIIIQSTSHCSLSPVDSKLPEKSVSFLSDKSPGSDYPATVSSLQVDKPNATSKQQSLINTFQCDSDQRTSQPESKVIRSTEILLPEFKFEGQNTGKNVPSSHHLLCNIYKTTDLRPGATELSKSRSQAQQMNLLRKRYHNVERILARENHRKQQCKRRNEMLRDKEHLWYTEEEQRHLVEEAEKEFTKFIEDIHLKRKQQIHEESEQQKESSEQELRGYRKILNLQESMEKHRIQKLEDSDLLLVEEEEQRRMMELLEQEFTDFIEDATNKPDKTILKVKEKNHLETVEKNLEKEKDQQQIQMVRKQQLQVERKNQIQKESERQQLENEDKWKQRFSSVPEFLPLSPLCSCSYFLGKGTGCAHNCVYYTSSKEKDRRSHENVSRTLPNVSLASQVVSRPPRIRKIFRRP